jgi:hypothetical protein
MRNKKSILLLLLLVVTMTIPAVGQERARRNQKGDETLSFITFFIFHLIPKHQSVSELINDNRL